MGKGGLQVITLKVTHPQETVVHSMSMYVFVISQEQEKILTGLQNLGSTLEKDRKTYNQLHVANTYFQLLNYQENKN